MLDNRFTVAVLDDYQRVAEGSADWAALGENVEVTFLSTKLEGSRLQSDLQPFDIIIAMRERTPFDAALLASLPRLQLLVSTGMVNDSIDLEAAARQHIIVCGTRGETAGASELTWALILALARNVTFEDAAIRAGRWQTTIGTGLSGSVLGVVGLGRYGAEVSRIANAFGMEVLAWSAHLTEAAAEAAGAKLVSKAELFRRADFVSVHYKLGPRSVGIVGREDLELMKSTAFLVNTSRGPLVDESALIAALTSGTIAGAGLDVYDREPISVDSPLLTAPRTILTPHLGFVTRSNYGLYYSDAIEDIKAFIAGSPVRLL